MRSIIVSGFPHLGPVFILCQPCLTLKGVYPGVFSDLEIQLAGLRGPILVRTSSAFAGSVVGSSLGSVKPPSQRAALS